MLVNGGLMVVHGGGWLMMVVEDRGYQGWGGWWFMGEDGG